MQENSPNRIQEAKVKKKEYDRLRRIAKREELRAYDRFRRENDPARAAADKRSYEKHRESRIARVMAYSKRNTKKISARFKERYHSDPIHRLKVSLRNRINRGLRSGSAVRDLGCSIAEFKTYLEDRFYSDPKTGKAMSWTNRSDWHIDHIKPLASFDLTDRAQFLQAVHYTNLQPLWAEENLRKGAK